MEKNVIFIYLIDLLKWIGTQHNIKGTSCLIRKKKKIVFRPVPCLSGQNKPLELIELLLQPNNAPSCFCTWPFEYLFPPCSLHLVFTNKGTTNKPSFHSNVSNSFKRHNNKPTTLYTQNYQVSIKPFFLQNTELNISNHAENNLVQYYNKTSLLYLCLQSSNTSNFVRVLQI